MSVKQLFEMKLLESQKLGWPGQAPSLSLMKTVVFWARGEGGSPGGLQVCLYQVHNWQFVTPPIIVSAGLKNTCFWGQTRMCLWVRRMSFDVLDDVRDESNAFV